MDLVLPSAARKAVYAALVLLGLVSGAIAVAYSALDVPLPDWYRAGTAVLAFLAAAPAVLALLNVTQPVAVITPPAVEPEPVEPAAETPAAPAA